MAMTIERPRLIDKDKSVRTRPMRILALGMPRTGTSSLREALTLLGYKPFHFRTLILEYRRYIPLWTEALKAKYDGKCKPYGREEFDKLVGDYDVLEDNPSILFVDELIAAYPDAKIILTNRDVDAWVKSMEKTIFKFQKSQIYKWLYPLHPISRSWKPFTELISRVSYGAKPDAAKARTRFDEHYRHIREIVPKERILEMSFSDSWDSLCQFLEVPVPDVPYPHSNDSYVFNGKHSFYQAALVMTLIGVTVLGILTTSVVQQAWMLYNTDSSLFWSFSKLAIMVYIVWVISNALLNRYKSLEKTIYQAYSPDFWWHLLFNKF